MACTKENPIIGYIENIISIYNTDPLTLTFEQIMLDNPFYDIGNTCDYLCSDCGNFSYVGFMFNSDGDGVLYKIFDRMGESFPNSCCENYDLNSIKKLSDYINKVFYITDYTPLVCCNSFNDCSSTFNNLVQKYLVSDPLLLFEINTYGIHEYGTFNNNSSLCEIITAIQPLNDAGKISFFKGLNVLGGFVSYCSGDNVYVGTAEGFRNWW